MVAVEVVPGPSNECVSLAVHAAEQHCVYAEPGGEGDRALHLMVMLADLGNRRVAADHRHDALVLVDKGFGGLSVQLTENVLPRPLPRLLGHRAQLGQRCPVVT